MGKLKRFSGHIVSKAGSYTPTKFYTTPKAALKAVKIGAKKVIFPGLVVLIQVLGNLLKVYLRVRGQYL